MSYFPNMLQPSGNAAFDQYVLHVAQHGVLVVYRVIDGKATSLVAGSAADVIGIPLRAADPDAFVVTLPMSHAGASRSYRFGFEHDLWVDVAATLNGKPGVRRTEARAVYWTLRRLGMPVSDFIQTSGGASLGFKVTDAALAADEEFRRKNMEEDRP